MTKLPHDNRDVQPLKGEQYPDYRVNQTCAVPGCGGAAMELHHIWRRSYLAGPYSWVRLWDGTEVGNLVGLCHDHHADVTENRAHIEWRERDGCFTYSDLFMAAVPLTWQPPHQHLNMLMPSEGSSPNEVGQTDSSERCPTCGRRPPKPKVETPPEQKKIRRTWALTVPVDEREDGADVLDGLIEAARQKIADDGGPEYGDGRKQVYYVLTTALSAYLLS